eukprot:6438392-Amphidinium_carterae.3
MAPPASSMSVFQHREEVCRCCVLSPFPSIATACTTDVPSMFHKAPGTKCVQARLKPGMLALRAPTASRR